MGNKRRRWMALAAGFLSGCVTAPKPHPRALEANVQCATSIAAGDIGRAEILCDFGLEYAPAYADLWVNKGVIAFQRGQFQLARKHMLHALRLNSESAHAYNNLGQLDMQALDYAHARDYLRRALAVDPAFSGARLNLATALTALRDHRGARKELLTILEADPDNVEARTQLGVVALDEGHADEAVERFRDVTKRAATAPTGWFGLGNALTAIGLPCQGVDAFARCTAVAPTLAECRNNAIIAQERCQLERMTRRRD